MIRMNFIAQHVTKTNFEKKKRQIKKKTDVTNQVFVKTTCTFPADLVSTLSFNAGFYHGSAGTGRSLEEISAPSVLHLPNTDEMSQYRNLNQKQLNAESIHL